MGKHARPRDGWSRQRTRTQARWLVLDTRDAVVACIVGLLLVSLAPVLMGWKTTVVVSGSMMPRIQPGDVISAAPPPLEVETGTIVLVDDPAHPGELLMHRVIRFDETGHMITKGDANPTADSTPVPMANLVGVPRVRIPYIGLPYLWIRQGRYMPVGAAAVLLLTLLLWQPPPRRPAPPGGRRSLLSGPVDADPYRLRRPSDDEPVSNPAASISYSMPPPVRPNWNLEAAAAVFTGNQ